MDTEVSNVRKPQKDRKIILREKNQNKSKELVEIQKVEEKELLREVTVKIGLEKIDIKEGILMEVLEIVG